MERLRERISGWRDAGSQVDRGSRVVRNIALAGQDSRNGYRYSEQALLGAVALYENRPVFLDHAVNGARPHERSTRDLIGSIQKVRFEQGRIRGDIQVLETEAGRTFLALVESNTRAVGMSHVVLASRSADKKTVERIEEVISVDAVVFPATTTTFREQMSDDSPEGIVDSFEWCLQEVDEALQQLDSPLQRVATFVDFVVTDSEEDGDYEIRRWNVQPEGGIELSEVLGRASREELESGAWRDRLEDPTDTDIPADEVMPERLLLAELKVKTLQERQLRQRYRRLLKKYAELGERQQKAGQVQRLLAESRLSEEAVSAEFVRLLQETKDEKSQRELIAERQKLWRNLHQRKPGSAGRMGSENRVQDEMFIRAVRH